jgi:D-glycero-D-manno-heptose 1,7-bisphosphate phosphatase
MTKLILLDRDGVINHDSAAFIKSADEWLAIPGSLEAIALLKAAGRLVAVCSNQSGIAKGLISHDNLNAIENKMHRQLRALGAELDQVRYCPHDEGDGCSCRKPEPGMLVDIMEAMAVDSAETCFVGDSFRDLQAARAAGCEPILVRTGNGGETLDHVDSLGKVRVFDDLAAFAQSELGEG